MLIVNYSTTFWPNNRLNSENLCNKWPSTIYILFSVVLFLMSNCAPYRSSESHTLDLYRQELTAFPNDIFTRTSLTELNLWGNKLTTLPPEIANLKNLQRLYLAHNRLTSLPPEIGELANLEFLHLGYNKLAALPPEIGRLEKLRTLFLDSNHLTKLPVEFEKLANLQTLSLKNNQFESLPPAIKKLSKLQRLYLENNKISSLITDIKDLKNLKELYFFGNRLSVREIQMILKMYPRTIFTEPPPEATVDKRPSSLIRLEAKSRDYLRIIRILLCKIPGYKTTFYDFIRCEKEKNIKSIEDQIEFRLEFINFLLEKIEKQKTEGDSK